MKSVRKHYLGLGNTLEQLEASGHYLAQVSLDASIELDYLRRGRNKGMQNVDELARIIKKYQAVEKNPYAANIFLPFAWALHQPMTKFWPHKHPDLTRLKTLDELGLQMHLFTRELKSATDASPEQLTELLHFCVDLSTQFSGRGQTFKRYFGT